MDHYLVIIEPCKTGYGAFSPDVPGCIATGPTVEQTLSEMRAALIFHFEGMTESGEPIPKPRGLEYYVGSGEAVADPGDLITTLAAAELLAELPAGSHVA